MRIYTGTVSAVSTPYPGFIRVRLEHKDFRWSRPIGDFYIKILVGDVPEDLESRNLSRREILQLDILMRTYTIADVGPGWIELDCVAGHAGPGTDWFRQAEIGQRLCIIAPDPGEELWAPALKLPPSCELIAVIDSTAFPALKNLEAEWEGPITSLLYGFEIEGYESAHNFEELLSFLDGYLPNEEREVSEQEESECSEDYLWDMATSSSPTQFFFAGESGMIKKLRRHSLARGVERTSVSFMGYWRRLE
ncbi:MAG: siderophore-interacting protein [Corynebacterium sp.]|nr:siderophore-interacting protein [Corynebacterium sp.]